MHQLTLPIDPLPEQPPTPIGTLYAPPCPMRRQTERDRLMAELATVERRKAKIAARQLTLRSIKSKLDRRSQSISQQLESLDRNPMAILRYQSSLVPEQMRGDLWIYRPLSDLRLERDIGLRTFELLVACCPTIGDLEITRIHEGLSSLRGIGKARADKIERRLLEWLGHNAFGYVPGASFEHRGRGEGKLDREIVL